MKTKDQAAFKVVEPGLIVLYDWLWFSSVLGPFLVIPPSPLHEQGLMEVVGWQGSSQLSAIARTNQLVTIREKEKENKLTLRICCMGNPQILLSISVPMPYHCLPSCDSSCILGDLKLQSPLSTGAEDDVDITLLLSLSGLDRVLHRV